MENKKSINDLFQEKIVNPGQKVNQEDFLAAQRDLRLMKFVKCVTSRPRLDEPHGRVFLLHDNFLEEARYLGLEEKLDKKLPEIRNDYEALIIEHEAWYDQLSEAELYSAALSFDNMTLHDLKRFALNRDSFIDYAKGKSGIIKREYLNEEDYKKTLFETRLRHIVHKESEDQKEYPIDLVYIINRLMVDDHGQSQPFTVPIAFSNFDLIKKAKSLGVSQNELEEKYSSIRMSYLREINSKQIFAKLPYQIVQTDRIPLEELKILGKRFYDLFHNCSPRIIRKAGNVKLYSCPHLSKIEKNIDKIEKLKDERVRITFENKESYDL